MLGFRNVFKRSVASLFAVNKEAEKDEQKLTLKKETQQSDLDLQSILHAISANQALIGVVKIVAGSFSVAHDLLKNYKFTSLELQPLVSLLPSESSSINEVVLFVLYHLMSKEEQRKITRVTNFLQKLESLFGTITRGESQKHLIYLYSLVAEKEKLYELSTYNVHKNNREISFLRTNNVEFQSTKSLGQGSFGAVYAGKIQELNQQKKSVAIKLFVNKKLSQQDLLKEFLHEISINNHLKHNNIVTFHGVYFNKEQQRFGLVLELMELNLWSLIKENPLLPIGRRIDIAISVLAGLSYMHQQGILHCDIKSENVLIGCEGEVKITDLGLASIESKNESAGWGTPRYKAPEVLFENAPCTKASDMYSFGLLMYEIEEGKLAWSDVQKDNGELRHKKEEEKGRRPRLTDDKSEISALIRHCWHWKPKDRSSSGEALVSLEKLRR